MAGKAYSYIRFSTPEQAMGDSLRRQLEGARRWAREHGYGELDESYRDLGISAYSGANRSTGALSRFLAGVECGEIAKGAVLIVESLDRLSRDELSATLPLFTSLLAAGIDVVTLSDGKHYTPASANNLGDLLMSLVIMSRAHEESSMKSIRQSKAWERKRANALQKPLTSVLPNWLRLNSKNEIKLIPERVAIVRQIFERSAAGVGSYSITRELNESHVAPWGRSDGWNESYVKKILLNRAVLGEYQPHSGKRTNRRRIGEPVSNYYPAVIDEALFHRAVASRKNRNFSRAGGRRGKKFANLLTRVCRCVACGATMRYQDKGASSETLICSSYLRNTGCQNSTRHKYREIESIALTELAQHVDWYSAFASEQNQAAELRKQLDEAEATAAENQRKADRLLALFESADESMLEHAQARYTEIAKELSAAKEAVEQLKAQLSASDNSAPEAQLERLQRAFAMLDTIADANELYAIRASINAAFRKALAAIWLGPGLVAYTLQSGERHVLTYDQKSYDLQGVLSQLERSQGLIAGLDAEIEREKRRAT